MGAELIIMGAIILWAFYCNRKSLSEREELFEKALEMARAAKRNGDAEWKRFYDRYFEVSGEAHVLRRLCFLDPMTLYKLED